MHSRSTTWRVLVTLFMLAALVIPSNATGAPAVSTTAAPQRPADKTPQRSGAYEYRRTTTSTV
ncbi:MAG: hypothetical protein M3Q29_00435 [Chloroflexota bacterium]|nr:hypothetical protein [Chloroflexota bacterium]